MERQRSSQTSPPTLVADPTATSVQQLDAATPVANCRAILPVLKMPQRSLFKASSSVFAPRLQLALHIADNHPTQ